MSSCGVYSLFPIYTPDTLVERKELVGKWLSDDDTSTYISFSRVSYNIKTNNKNESKNDDKISISFGGDGNSDVIDTEHYVIENGDTTLFKDTLLVQFEELIEKKINLKFGEYEPKDKQDTYYTMRFVEDGEDVSSFKAHLVQIGECV